MPLDTFRTVLSRRPAWVVGAWLIVALGVGLAAPNLTKLAAEGQSKLLGPESESRRAAELVRRAWPDQSYESTAVLALHRPTDLDRGRPPLRGDGWPSGSRRPTGPGTSSGCWGRRRGPRSPSG